MLVVEAVVALVVPLMHTTGNNTCMQHTVVVVGCRLGKTVEPPRMTSKTVRLLATLATVCLVG